MVLIDLPAPFLQTSYRGSGKPCNGLLCMFSTTHLAWDAEWIKCFGCVLKIGWRTSTIIASPYGPLVPQVPLKISEVLTLPRSPIDYFPKIMEMSQARGSLSQVHEGDVCSQARLARYWRQHPYACSQMLKPFRPFPALPLQCVSLPNSTAKNQRLCCCHSESSLYRIPTKSVCWVTHLGISRCRRFKPSPATPA